MSFLALAVTPLYKKDWVVNVQKPMGNPEKILESIRNFRQPNCPACKKGRLRFAGVEKDIPWEPG